MLGSNRGYTENGLLRLGARLGLLLTTTTLIAAGGLAGLTPQAAAQTVQAEGANAGARRSFNIPAQPLANALNAFGRQSGLQVTLSAETSRGVRSNAVIGAFTPQQALASLLQGTGISFRITNDRTAIIGHARPASQASAADGSTVLDPIDVVAGSNGGATADTPYQTPGSSSTISAEQLERVPPTSPGDLFKSTPGVISAGNRVGQSIDLNIRGLQGQGRVNVMVDGTRQTNNSYRGYRGSRNEVYVDPDFIGGIAIEKGPVGTAGGLGAMGGVVNMRTIEAGDIVKQGQIYGVRVKGGLSSNTQTAPATGTKTFGSDAPPFFNGDAWSGSVAAAMAQENYEFVAAFSRRQSGNYFAGKNGKATFWDNRVPWQTPSEMPLSPFKPGNEVFNTSEDTTSFLAKGKVRFGEGHSLELGYIRYESNYGENDETLLGFVGSTIIVPLEQYALSRTATNTFTAKYAYEPDDNPYWNLHANAWFTDVQTTSEVVKSNSGSLPGVTGKVPIKTMGSEVYNISSFDTPLGGLSLNNGFEIVREASREAEYYVKYPWLDDPVFLSRNPAGTRLMAGAFSKAKLDVNDWLTLGAGLRYDRFEAEGKGYFARYPKTEGGRLNPSASVTLTPWDGIQLYGMYTEGWRPPSLRETASLPQNMDINPNLKPELSKNYEVGVNVLRDNVLLGGDRLRLKASYFDNNYDDFIVRIRNPLPYPAPSYTWGNIDAATFQGFELSANYDAGFIFLEGAFTKYLKVESCNAGVCSSGGVGTDYGVAYMPPEYSGSLTIGTRMFEDALTLGTRVNFFGERYGGYALSSGAVRAPVFWHANAIVDVFGSYKFNQDVALNFSAENVFDEYYLDPLSTGLIPSPGRTIRMSLTSRF